MKKSDSRQAINGVLLVNKPQGLTSNGFLQQMKRLYNARKAGHTGSLDPLATGMLPICFGEATKFSQYLLDADKCYEATGLLGIKTDTADALGNIIQETSSFTVTEHELQAALNAFRGTIQQVPSMFSALKHQGVPLYKYARKGETIARAAREISIHSLELTAFDGKSFSIRVHCSKGTYIRNLVEDIGERLRVGAHVTRLHRTHTAGFTEETMYSLEALTEKSEAKRIACLLPMDKIVDYMPTLCLKNEAVFALRQGKTLSEFTDNAITGCFRLYDEALQFIGLGDINSSGTLAVKRLLAIGELN
ncbi:MAG: tRNA pseudouridine(55) synthase TruB [Tatlockia sp.]